MLLAQKIKEVDRPPKMHFYQLFGDRSEHEQNKCCNKWCIKDNALQTCFLGWVCT